MAPPTVSSEKWKVALHLSANRKKIQGPGHPNYFKLEGSNPQVTFVQSVYTLPLSFGSQICLMWDIWRAYKIFMRLADCFLPIYWGAPLCCWLCRNIMFADFKIIIGQQIWVLWENCDLLPKNVKRNTKNALKCFLHFFICFSLSFFCLSRLWLKEQSWEVL